MLENDSKEKMTCMVKGTRISEPKIEACGLRNNFFQFENLFTVNSYPGIKTKSIINYTFNESLLLKKTKIL